MQLTIEAAKGLFFDRAAVTAAADAATMRACSRFGAFVRTRARSSIRQRRAVSDAGSPPSSHTGLLRDWILFAWDDGTRSVVIGPAKLSRPGAAPEVLEQGGTQELTITAGRGLRRRVLGTRKARYRARPYMRPAFEAELQRAPGLWAGAIKKG